MAKTAVGKIIAARWLRKNAAREIRWRRGRGWTNALSAGGRGGSNENDEGKKTRAVHQSIQSG